MTDSTTFYFRCFAVCALGLMGYVTYRILAPFFVPLLWAGLLAFLLFPVNVALRARLRGRKGAAALVLTIISVIGILVPLGALTVLVGTQASDLLGRMKVVQGVHVGSITDLIRIPAVQHVMDAFTRYLPVGWEQVRSWAIDAGRSALQFVVHTSGSVFSGAVSALVDLALTVFLLFFFFRDGEWMIARSLALVPMAEGKKARLVEHLGGVTRAVVLGTLVTAVVQGALVTVGFVVVGVPSPIVFGVLATAAALLPVGTAIVWAPVAIGLGVFGHWGAAGIILLWGAVVVGTSDNFLRPLLISGQASSLTTLPVFIGLIGGVSAFGAVGLFLGPVFVALVLSLLELIEEWRRVPDSQAVRPAA